MRRSDRGVFGLQLAQYCLWCLVVSCVCISTAVAELDRQPLPIRETPPIVRKEAAPTALPEDPSAFTSVIRPADFAGEAKDLEDLLARSVGVQVRRFGGPGQRAEISIRGSTPNQVVILLDGIRLNSAQSGALDLSTISLDSIERIEVSRGAGSAQAGSDAIGGVINLVSKRIGGKSGGAVALGTESFGAQRFHIEAREQFRSWQLYGGYTGFRSRGDFEFLRPVVRGTGFSLPFLPRQVERVNNRVLRHGISLKAGRGLGEAAYLSLENHWGRISRGRPGQDPGNGELAGQRARAHERATHNLSRLHVDWSPPGFSGLRASADLYYRLARSHFHDAEISGGGPFDTKTRNDSLGTKAHLDFDFDRWSIQQHVRVALDARVERVRRDSQRISERASRRRRTYGVFVQDEAIFFDGRLHLIPGLRLDSTEGFGLRSLPRLGLIAKLVKGVELRANLERAFRAPNLDELFFANQGFLRGNPNLQQEESDQFDIGLRLTREKLGWLRNMQLEFAYFDQRLEDSIVFVLISNGVVSPQNTGPARIRGMELRADLALQDWLRLHSNYTHVNAKNRKTGLALPARARNKFSLRLELGKTTSPLLLIAELNQTSEIPVSESGGTRLSDRSVYDLTLVLNPAAFGITSLQRFTSPISALRIGVRNVTDRSVRDAQFFPQPGRVWFMSLEGKW